MSDGDLIVETSHVHIFRRQVIHFLDSGQICMLARKSAFQYICSRCLHQQSKVQARFKHHEVLHRGFSSTSSFQEQQSAAQRVANEDFRDERNTRTESTGAMSRRLADMTDESLESGGRSATKAVKEAGFSEDLKRQLEAKIHDANFRDENPAAFAQLNIPVCPWP